MDRQRGIEGGDPCIGGGVGEEGVQEEGGGSGGGGGEAEEDET